MNQVILKYDTWLQEGLRNRRSTTPDQKVGNLICVCWVIVQPSENWSRIEPVRYTWAEQESRKSILTRSMLRITSNVQNINHNTWSLFWKDLFGIWGMGGVECEHCSGTLIAFLAISCGGSSSQLPPISSNSCLSTCFMARQRHSLPKARNSRQLLVCDAVGRNVCWVPLSPSIKRSSCCLLSCSSHDPPELFQEKADSLDTGGWRWCWVAKTLHLRLIRQL